MQKKTIMEKPEVILFPKLLGGERVKVNAGWASPAFKTVAAAFLVLLLLTGFSLVPPASAQTEDSTCQGSCCESSDMQCCSQGAMGCCQQAEPTETDSVLLSGEERNRAVALALSDQDVTQLLTTLTHEGYTLRFSNSTAAKIIIEEGSNTTQPTTHESLFVSLPFKADEYTAGILFRTDDESSYSYAVTLDQREDTWILTTYYVENGEVIETSSNVGGHSSCDYWCLLSCAFQNPQVWAECVLFCWCAWSSPFCLVPCILCIIGLGAVSAICTIPCGCWEPEETSVTIKVESTPIQDWYARYHGVSLDEPLDSRFWQTQPEKIIKTTGSAFTWEQTYSLSSGEHYFVYAPSSYWPNYYWNTKIYVNGQLVAQGDTGYNHQLTAYFNV